MNKLFVLDAMALIYRAHFAFVNNPRINSKGMNTGASFGFINTLLEIISKEKPTHLVVAFDTDAPTFRHESFAEYKGHRQAQPEDISLNIPYIKRLIKAFDIPILEVDGFEADDIIGTIACKFARPDFKIYMMTPDKDFCQLVNENVFVYRPAYMGKGAEVYDTAKVLEKFGIKRVDQVRDILGLQGDSVDNIPGIPGIGEKTAQKLIAEFDTVENLIANADKLSGKLKENVLKFAEQGLMSKELATIHCEVPLELIDENLTYTSYNKALLEPLLDELEFRNLKIKLITDTKELHLETTIEIQTGKGKKKNPNQTSLFDGPAKKETDTEPENLPAVVYKDNFSTVHTDYHLVDSRELRSALIKSLKEQKEFCFDTETTSTNAVKAELVGISFSYLKSEAFYIPFPEERKEVLEILSDFKEILEDENILKIGHNLKYDITVLSNYDINVKGPLFDTMLAHYLLEPEMRHGMDFLSATYLNYQPIPISDLIGKKGESQGNMREVKVEEIVNYASEDADVTLQLKEVFYPMLKKNGVEKLFDEIENPLIYALAEIESAGVKIDTKALAEYSKLLEKDSQICEEVIYNLAGERFNIGSPKQLGTILFDKLKLGEKHKMTDSGQYATGEEILSKLAGEHEIAGKILEYREYQKLKSTYVDALPQMINEKTGMVHTCFNQAVAATGRLSSTNPNLQNIPIRTDRGKEIRRAFITRSENSLILSADYSQIELRIMASFSKDASMTAAFRNGIDIHTTTASKVFGVEIGDVTSEMRRRAKMVNFGIIYGISAFGLGQRLSIPRKEASEIIEAYWKEFPSIRTYMDNIINEAREKEYVETITGRRRYLRDINSRNVTLRGFAERNAINAPIQGSAADIIKKAMIDIHNWMKKEKLKSKMVLQVHDELVFDVMQDELDVMKPQIEFFMKHAIPLEVPMEIGMGTGLNWLEAH